MTTVPRWEWRTFNGDLRTALVPLRALHPIDRATSDEIYLLSCRSEASVKLREGRLDAKGLEQRDDSGLELWRPVMSAQFPVSAAIVVEVLELLHVPNPTLSRTAYGAKEVLDEIVAHEPSLRAVSVHKSRTKGGVEGGVVFRSAIKVKHCIPLHISSNPTPSASAYVQTRELGRISITRVNPRGVRV